MPLTLRQLQKMFSAAARGSEHIGRDLGVLGDLAAHVSGNPNWRRASVAGTGGLLNSCKCRDCRRAGESVSNVRQRVDRWVRQYGPNAELRDILAAEKGSAAGQKADGDDAQQQGQQQQGQQQQQPGQQQDSGDQTQTTGPASGSGSGAGSGQTQPAQKATVAEPQPTPEQQALNAAKAELREAVKAADGAGKKPSSTAAVQIAQRKVRRARKQVSFNAKAEASGVSLSARQQVSRGLGRLQRVSQKLRNQMAELINRLVEQGGTVGETFGPVPVLSATKLVKRMVVHRPLPNALKEDTVAGRPVVLFLPDISPSCAEQAQVACDLANAAGYAGVSGSDVLVLPHFNGGVDSTEEYIPWFNGKPAATNPQDARRLFREVCSGQSSYRVRVAVFLGDHDAVDEYGSIAMLKSVTRVLWLHNLATSNGGKRGWTEPASARVLPDWRPEAREKLSMVVGCVDQPRMLAGFDMALKMR
jgi:hypothetical protein